MIVDVYIRRKDTGESVVRRDANFATKLTFQQEIYLYNDHGWYGCDCTRGDWFREEGSFCGRMPCGKLIRIEAVVDTETGKVLYAEYI